jgi:hypothetical protein
MTTIDIHALYQRLHTLRSDSARRLALSGRAAIVAIRPTSVTIYLALMAYLGLVKLIITLVPAPFRSAAQAGVFAWPFIAVVPIVGLAGLWFAQKADLPDAWDARISNRQRFLIPALLGLALSLPSVALDLLTHYTTIQAAQHGLARFNIDFPASLLIYPGGAIIVEVIYRLLLMPMLLWLVGKVALRNHGIEPLFWVLAVATSLIEPLTQDLDLGQFGTVVMVSAFGLDFGLNLTQAVLFRRYGFLAAIVMRVAFYIIWHIVYVH